jgi:hypothetical protein
MGKKEQELQIEIMYSRGETEKTYTVERTPQSQGITYSEILEIRNQFMNDNQIFT